MPGYADLDEYGGWRQYPDYGPVWFPRGVEVGWAPYHFGHWAWIAPWGWTWVDDAPWGYAPFHYGRWAFVAGAWGWVPGPVVVGVRPVYAPALVAWVGGPRFGVAVGIGGGVAVGWFPLGPREVFVPSYHYSAAYVERVNVTNTVIVNRAVFREREINVTNVTYVNRGVPGAMTAVSHETIVTGRPVAAAAIRVRPEALGQATIVTHAAVVPERAAVLGGREVVRTAPPAVVVNRTVVTRTHPPDAPVSFEHQRTALQANPGRPLSAPAMNQVRSSAPAPVQRPMYRQAPAAPAQQPQMRQEERRATPQFQQPRPAERQEQPRPQQQQQQQQQPRPMERRNPPAPLQPQAQPQQQPQSQPQPRSVERNMPPPQQREQKQEDRRQEKQHRDERREKEKEKGKS